MPMCALRSARIAIPQDHECRTDARRTRMITGMTGASSGRASLKRNTNRSKSMMSFDQAAEENKAESGVYTSQKVVEVPLGLKSQSERAFFTQAGAIAARAAEKQKPPVESRLGGTALPRADDSFFLKRTQPAHRARHGRFCVVRQRKSATSRGLRQHRLRTTYANENHTLPFLWWPNLLCHVRASQGHWPFDPLATWRPFGQPAADRPRNSADRNPAVSGQTSP